MLNVGFVLEMSEYRYRRHINLLPHLFNYCFEEVLKREDILKDYEFNMIIKDTKVSELL